MKRFLTVLVLCLLIIPSAARAEGADDDYVAIYSLIQQGDALSAKGQLALGLARYREAETALKSFHTNNPGWNSKVVQFRLKYLATKITDLSAQPAYVAPKPAAPVSIPAISHETIPSNPPPPAPIPAPEAAPTMPAPLYTGLQMTNLQQRIHDLEADRALLQAKLKEALAAQPVPIDPQEFARIQEQLKNLQKENDLLKASLAEAKTNAAQTAAGANGKVLKDLNEAHQKITQLAAANAALAQENESLQARLKSGTAPDQTVSALRDENAMLKKQLSDLQSRPASNNTADELNRKLKESQAQLASLQSDKEILRLEKIALEIRVKQLSGAAASAPVTAATTSPTVAPAPMLDSASAARIAQLEQQRNELQAGLDAANHDLQANKKGKESSARVEEMTRQMAALHARIDVLEAHPVAYSPTELALFSQSNATLIASVRVKKPARELPANASVLLAEAQRYFAAHELDKAEAKYLEVLKLDEKNTVTLGDLAYLEIELGHFAEADKYLHSALDLDPNDDYCFFLLGKLRFLQKNYDEGLDAASRAAQLNPQRADTQNLLGIILSEKGLHGPAETAFRKAIQLNPSDTDAHFNLAVVYITQHPPLSELARWHYQKALAAGHAVSPDLEKLLNAGGAAVNPAH